MKNYGEFIIRRISLSRRCIGKTFCICLILVFALFVYASLETSDMKSKTFFHYFNTSTFLHENSSSITEVRQQVKGLTNLQEDYTSNKLELLISLFKRKRAKRKKRKDFLSKTDRKLLENSYYKTLNISYSKNKTRTNLLILISSAPERYQRRLSIRKTWWRQCKKIYKKTARCLFFTDNVSENHTLYHSIQKEVLLHKDTILQNVSGGINFGVRMIYHMLYAQLNYNFDYLLIVDDDYFVCLRQLLYELPMPPLKEFHWGWVHRDDDPSTRRSDQSINMFSKDVILKFLLQNSSSILCHPWADIMIRIWTDHLNLRHIYRHDERLHHDPPAAYIPRIRNARNVCNSYMGIHGSYPYNMLTFWNNRGRVNKTKRSLYNNSWSVPINASFCWTCLPSEWVYEPRRCIENYVWNTEKQGTGSYVGRAGIM